MRHPEIKPIFDRTVGMGLLLTVALQTAGGIHWAGQMAARVDQLELKAALTHPINLRLARLEEQMTASRASLERIERDLHLIEETADE